MTELGVCGNINENLVTKVDGISEDNFHLYTIDAVPNENTKNNVGNYLVDDEQNKRMSDENNSDIVKSFVEDSGDNVENRKVTISGKPFEEHFTRKISIPCKEDNLPNSAAEVSHEVSFEFESASEDKEHIEDLPKSKDTSLHMAIDSRSFSSSSSYYSNNEEKQSEKFIERKTLSSETGLSQVIGREEMLSGDELTNQNTKAEASNEMDYNYVHQTMSTDSRNEEDTRDSEEMSTGSGEKEDREKMSPSCWEKKADENMSTGNRDEEDKDKMSYITNDQHSVTKSGQFDHEEVNDVENDDEDLDRFTNHGKTYGPITTSMSEITMEHPSGLRGKANTPVSHFTGTEYTEDLGIPTPASRSRSRLGSDARDVVYKQAMDLMSLRCSSSNQTPIDNMQDNQQFYVHQERPVPMPPLKVWRGYHGNVYFEPIHVVKVNDALKKASASNCRPNTSKLNQTFLSGHKPETTFSRRTNSGFMRSKSAKSVKTPFILDKRAVLEKFDDNIEEDIKTIEGTLSTGSLCQKTKIMKTNLPRAKTADKNRIYKGSVAHRVYLANKEKSKIFLTVTGDKFSPPSSTSPLLRTQTQYSLSTQRTMMNSPDYGFDHRLPPLEQFRNSLKHYDSAHEPYRGFPFGRSTTWTEDYKPYIKYSPDVKAKFDKQLHYI